MVTPAQRGFTLIELLVTIAIAVFLMLVAAPLTVGWVNAAHVRQAAYRLHEGMAQAKATALRNGGAATVDQPAAMLVVEGRQLCVYASTPAALNCGAGAVWRSSVEAEIRVDGQTSQCIALNNRALQVDATVGMQACGDGAYAVARGNERYPQDGTLALY